MNIEDLKTLSVGVLVCAVLSDLALLFFLDFVGYLCFLCVSLLAYFCSRGCWFGSFLWCFGFVQLTQLTNTHVLNGVLSV